MTCCESHPDLDALELHVVGQLSEPEHGEVKDHVLMCDSCHQMALALTEQIVTIPPKAQVGSGIEGYSSAESYLAVLAWLAPA